MTLHVDVARGRAVVARGCNLAEQRLEYLSELFETGRWRRFHTEIEFLENIHEAKAAVETWRGLVEREASLDDATIGLSWLGRRPSTPLSVVIPFRPEAKPVHLEAESAAAEPPVEVQGDVLAALESVLVGSPVAPPVVDAPRLDDVPPEVLDLDMIARRYPLLRNAL